MNTVDGKEELEVEEERRERVNGLTAGDPCWNDGSGDRLADDKDDDVEPEDVLRDLSTLPPACLKQLDSSCLDR